MKVSSSQRGRSSVILVLPQVTYETESEAGTISRCDSVEALSCLPLQLSSHRTQCISTHREMNQQNNEEQMQKKYDKTVIKYKLPLILQKRKYLTTQRLILMHMTVCK